MTIPLTQFARQFIADARPRADLAHPVLLLQQQPLIRTTEKTTQPIPDVLEDSSVKSGFGLSGGGMNDPVVFEVKKAGKPSNTFPHGVTFGRNNNNDICIPDDSVSGFHGYFEKDAKTGLWTLVDVGSLNGTMVGNVTLHARHVCADREDLVIGRVRLVFLSPGMFFAGLEKG